jgi:trehalose 2-sulfotransferase
LTRAQTAEADMPEPAIASDTANIPGLLAMIGRHLRLAPPSGAPFADRRQAVICMTPRSGSSYLGSMLEASGMAPTAEHFRIRDGMIERDAARLSDPTYEAYFRHKVESLSRPGGLFAVKCDWPQYAPVYATGMHARYLAGATFFYLTRQDVLAQAISRYVGTQSGHLHSPDGKAGALRDGVAFSYTGIRDHLDRLVRMQSDWERFFASEGITPHRLTYEALSADPAGTVRQIAQALGSDIDMPQVDTAYKVVRTGLNDELRAAFEAEHRRRIAAAHWKTPAGALLFPQ